MSATFTERLVNRIADVATRRKTSRRSFVAAAALTGTALAVDPWGYLTRPQSAYAAVCGPGASCSDGWSAMCCSINAGKNTCPPNTYAGGWWKADRSSYCGGAARYYIDCNALPGHHFTCRCNTGSCDHRLVACNVFRYGQCNTQVDGVTAVVCRQISCLPPWELYPGKCGQSSRTDNNTAQHTAPCLNHANTYPNFETFPAAPSYLTHGHVIHSNGRLTSLDRHTTFVMGSDGALRVHNENGIVWTSGTSGKAPGGHAHLYLDGELAILTTAGAKIWSNNVHGTGTSPLLVLHDSGDLTIADHGRLLWHTGTHTP